MHVNFENRPKLKAWFDHLSKSFHEKHAIVSTEFGCCGRFIVKEGTMVFDPIERRRPLEESHP